MRAAILLALTLSLLIRSASADQHDPRLPPLFAALRAAQNAVAAGEAENQIWTIWGEHDDPAAAALLEAGTVAMGARQWATALRDFDQLVAQHPDFAEAWNKRATLYYLMGDYDRSVADIEHTLALEPRHFGALSGMGLIFIAIDKPEAAIKSFEAGLAIHPYLVGAKTHIEALRQQLEGDTL